MHDRIEWTPFTKPPEPGAGILVCISCAANRPFITYIEHYTTGLETSLGFSQVIGWMPANLVLDAPMGYDPKFGDEKLCMCGHPYYRHFDTYEEMSPVGCKYCHAAPEGVDYRVELPVPDDEENYLKVHREGYVGKYASVCSGFKWDGVKRDAEN